MPHVAYYTNVVSSLVVVLYRFYCAYFLAFLITDVFTLRWSFKSRAYGSISTMNYFHQGYIALWWLFAVIACCTYWYFSSLVGQEDADAFKKNKIKCTIFKIYHILALRKTSASNRNAMTW